jgi:hypothetical protein
MRIEHLSPELWKQRPGLLLSQGDSTFLTIDCRGVLAVRDHVTQHTLLPVRAKAGR